MAEALDEASAYADFNYACDAIAPMLDEMSDADAPQFVKVGLEPIFGLFPII